MATTAGSEAAALKARLLREGDRFSFFQANRLLRHIGLSQGQTTGEVKSRPNVSLGFPDRDISQIVKRAEGGYQLTVNFLGLYGVSSPVPTFYSEDLLGEQQQGLTATRDFLDIFSQTIYPLFFRAWLKSKAHFRIVEFDDRRLLEIFYSFVGINQPEKYKNQPGFESLLRFAALYSQSPRSALGLQTILSASYPSAVIDLIEQDVRVIKLPDDQHLRLGQQATTLGIDTHIGREFACRSSNLTIVMREVDEMLLQQLLPGGYEHSRLKFLVQHYLVDPLNVAVDIYLKQGTAQPVILGQADWTGLGRDAWLVQANEPEALRVRVEL
jgi:type VI secretion system protein ImpH